MSELERLAIADRGQTVFIRYLGTSDHLPGLLDSIESIYETTGVTIIVVPAEVEIARIGVAS